MSKRKNTCAASTNPSNNCPAGTSKTGLNTADTCTTYYNGKADTGTTYIGIANTGTASIGMPGPGLRRHPLAYALLALGLALLVFLVFPLQEARASAGGVVSGSVVNVRSGPGTEHDIVGSLYRDTEVRVVNSSADWHQVQYGSLQGWVSAPLLTIRDQGRVIVDRDLVNLREGPGTSHAVVGQATRGESLLLLHNGGDWYQVRTGSGSMAYVSAGLVVPEGAAAGPTPAPAPANPAPANPAPANPAPAPAPAAPASPNPTVIFNQKKMDFDVPPIIQDGRTLVPLRAIFEAMGAQVDWDQATRTVTSQRGATTILLTIGSTQPIVNGQVWPLDVPAQIMRDRTLAPLRFVGEAFGGKVDWDQATRTVHIELKDPLPAIDPQPVTEEITVKVLGATVNLRSGPSTLFDATGQARSGDRLSVIGQQDDWYQVSRAGSISWVASWLVERDDSGNNPNSPQDPVADRPGDPPVEKPQPADPLKPGDPDDPGKEIDLRERLHISLSKDQLGLRVIMQSNRPLDFGLQEKNQVLTYRYEEMAPAGTPNFKESMGPAGMIEVSTRDYGSYTQVEIKLPAGMEYRTYSEDNGRREIVHISNYISKIERSSFGSTGEKIIITTALPSDYQILQQGDTLRVTLAQTGVGSIPQQYSYTSNLLRSVELIPRPAADETIVEIRTIDLGKHAVGMDNGNREIHVYMIGAQELKPRSDVVVLDAGHGGRDPGATGPTGLQEKTAVLQITRRAGEILKDQGIEVAYTRTGDTFVSLNERTEYANMINAALFVSIHTNGHTDPSKHGTETFFFAPMSNPQLFLQREERARLAGLLQREMVAALGRANRGVKESNFYVLRTTQMPSALVEVVFTTNPQEEALLRDPDFIERSAQSIARAISQYMR